MLNGKSVRVPTEATLDVVSSCVGMASDNVLFGLAESCEQSSRVAYLDGTSQQMSVMGETSGKGRAVEERELWPPL